MLWSGFDAGLQALASVQVWRSVVAPLAREGATALTFIAYDDDVDDRGLVAAALQGLTATVAAEMGGVAVEAVRVHGGRVFPLSSVGGEPVGEAVPSRADLPELAPLVAAGVAPTSSLGELVAAFRAGSAPAQRVGEVEVACRDWEARDGDVHAVAAFVAALGLVLSHGAPVGEFPPGVLGAAIVGLSYPDLRDAFVAWLVPAMRQGLQAGSPGAACREALVKVSGADGVAADSLEACARVRDRLRRLLVLCPQARSNLLGGVVGLFLWSLGDGVMARRVWEAALEVGPSFLAEVGLEVLRHGLGPGLLLGRSV